MGKFMRENVYELNINYYIYYTKVSIFVKHKWKPKTTLKKGA